MITDKFNNMPLALPLTPVASGRNHPEKKRQISTFNNKTIRKQISGHQTNPCHLRSILLCSKHLTHAK
jgi:hypothetical protein